MDWIEAGHFQLRHRCAICGNEPQIYPAKEGGYEVRCPCPGHTGFAREATWTERWKRGEAVPLIIANKIQKRRRER